MKNRGAGCSDTGTVRDHNEDRFLVNEELGLYVVSDGMGGHAAGEVAAEMTVSRIEWTVRAAADAIRAVERGNQKPSQLASIARDAVHAASNSIYEEASENPDRSGMGCTATVLLTAGGYAAMAHVGDSRLFLLRDGNIERLSTIHTVAETMVRTGQLSPTEAMEHYASKALSRCVGVQPTVEIESLYLNVHPGDVFLLCSDGVVETLESSLEISEHAAEHAPETLPEKLVETSNSRGSPDNVTAVTAWFETTDAEQKKLSNLGAQVDHRLDLLRRVSCFANIGFADLLRVHALCSVVECEKGQGVVQEDDTADRLCIIEAGAFSLESEEGSVQKLKAGDHIGQSTLLVSRKCRVVLRAESEGRVLVLSGKAFRYLAKRRPAVGVTMLLDLATTLSEELVEVRDLVEARIGSAGRTFPRVVVSFLSRLRGE